MADRRYLPPIRNVVYAGAGVGGISYLGAQKALEEYGLAPHIKNYAGSSAGALFSTLAACNVVSHDAIEYIMETNFADLLDSRSDNFISKGLDFYFGKGMYSGEALYDWIGVTYQNFFGNADISYGDIQDHYGCNIITMLSNVTKGRIEHFSSVETPDVPLRVGCRISAGVPIMFAPIKLNNHYYVDGAYFCPYPFHMFKDDVEGTLGWRVVNSANNDEGPGLTAYLKQLIYSPSVELSRWQKVMNSEKQTINVDAQGIDVLNFNIAIHEKRTLIDAGYTTTKDYLRMSMK